MIENIVLEYPYTKSKFRTFRSGNIKVTRIDKVITEVYVDLFYEGYDNWGYIRNTYKVNERVNVYDHNYEDIGGVIQSFGSDDTGASGFIKTADGTITEHNVLDFSKS